MKRLKTFGERRGWRTKVDLECRPCGGVKPGIRYGETDDYATTPVKDKVHLHDLHATMLHLRGFDHTKLTDRDAGRDFRLTDVHGEVVHGLLV